MKILHVIPSISFVHGGPSFAIFDMVRSLIEQDVLVEILTTNDNGQQSLKVPIQSKIIYNNVPCIFCRCLPYLKKYALSSDLAQWLWKNISNYDLLHIHSIFTYSSMVAMPISRYCKIPYIVRPLGHLCDWSLQQNTFVKKQYLKTIGFSSINNSSAIHFTTEQEEEEAKPLGLRPKSLVIPLGITPPVQIPNASSHVRRSLKIPDHAPIILFLSRIHPKKGLEYLIPALGQLMTSYHFHFIIAGEGQEEYKNYIIKLLENYSLKDRSHLVGFVEGEEKNELMQGSDIFVLTSHSENFGVVVLEAMASGLPVLLTQGVALASNIQKNQLGYVCDLSIESITQKLKDFLDNYHTVFFESIGKRGKEYVRTQYSWNMIAKNLVDVYNKILY